MKYILAIILSALALTSNAQHRYGPSHHHAHRGHSGHGWGWVAPALIGGAIVYGVTRPDPQPQPQIIYYPQALPPAPYGYRYEQLLDANCNCYRWVLVQG